MKMAAKLVIRAGRTALAHIRKNGLEPGDITAVIGASGAAKWLSIYGLDRAVFSRWLARTDREIFLFGTSIGAWKLAAAAQNNPGRAFDRLKAAYIRQKYDGRVTPDQIIHESLKIFDRFLDPQSIREILSHPRFRLGFSAVRCRGPMALENRLALVGGLGVAFVLNLVSRKTQSLFFRRTLFHCPAGKAWPLDLGEFPADPVPLTPGNFKPALLASGSIPVIMNGVRDIPGTPGGMYRDGGILDYHPAVAMARDRNGFILYPHFYPDITPGWFDKHLNGRRAAGPLLDRVVLVSPSKAFVAGLPFGRIPDRKDFKRFHNRDQLRFNTWETVARASLDLGEEFLETVTSGKIREAVSPFGGLSR